MAEAQELTKKTVLEQFEAFAHFSKVLLDAFAVVDTSGKVIKANQMFAQLSGIKMKALLKMQSFDDVLSLSLNDNHISVEDIINHDIPSRMDEVAGKAIANGEEKNLIIGIYPFIDQESGEKTGAFIMLRDVTAETNLQDQYKDKAIKSITDPLTGLYTRGHFEEFLEGLMGQLQKQEPEERQKVSLVMCDIDFFKKVNDQYGHQAGDYVLKIVAKLMMDSFRKTDVCCRYGGEEFLVILPHAKAEHAAIAANKLRNAVESEKIIFEDTHIPVTISCGIATIEIDKEDFDGTMSRADAALYQAKGAGRNLVCLHDGQQVIETSRD